MNKQISWNNHYHVWSDALHARELAKETRNQWDRGSYVRWSIISAWIVLEVACQDATGEKDISYKFRENLDSTLQSKFSISIDWKHGVWKQVSDLQGKRKKYMHQSISDLARFPKSTMAVKAIETVRQAVKDIYSMKGKAYPSWIDDDETNGFDRRESVSINANCVSDNAKKGDPETIEVYRVSEGQEILECQFKDEAKIESNFDRIIKNSNASISKVLAKRDGKVVAFRKVDNRGRAPF